MEPKSEVAGNLRDYYIRLGQRMAGREIEPGDAGTPELDRVELRARFMRSVGLEPMPTRGDLGTIETGSFEGPGYTLKKLAYQLLPDCWGSAHFYRPGGVANDFQTPAVLYACGHANPGVVLLQEHAIAWARRGYSCLIFDTIQQHDNPGEHHGLNLGRTPEWIALGYSATAGELFNGLRALDLLLEQPGVDAARVGVTGISGGGSQSFFLAIADPRIAAVATVAGVSDPAYAIPRRQVMQHCDCIYVRNVFAGDIALYASLVAPRALLYCFARHDTLFSPDEFRDLHGRSLRHFQRMGCGDRCALHEYDGPHGYNERGTTDAIHRWFDLHVAGQEHAGIDTLAIGESGGLPGESELSVFHGRTPSPNLLHLLPELLSPRGQIDLPQEPGDWSAIKEDAIGRLRREVFPLLGALEAPRKLELYGDWLVNKKYLRRAWRGELDGMEQCLVELSPADGRHGQVIVGVGSRESEALPLAGQILSQAKESGVLAIEPRACGVNAFPESHRNHFNREGCLVGMTPSMLMIQDLHSLWPSVCEMPSLEGREMILYGRGEGAIAMLYHALLHPSPRVKAVILEDLPSSHSDPGFQIMGILRVMNIPHAVGLLAPTPVGLINPGGTHFHWYFANRAHGRAGSKALVVGESLSGVLEEMFPSKNSV